jgi:hypothetical protein
MESDDNAWDTLWKPSAVKARGMLRLVSINFLAIIFSFWLVLIALNIKPTANHINEGLGGT